MKDETVRFLQLVCIFTDLVPKILVDVLKHHITLSKAFQKRFGKKPWNGGPDHREWLASVMKKNPKVQDFSYAAVKKNPVTKWDVTNLSAALSAVMDPSDVPCDVAVTQACSKSDRPIGYFNVSVSERSGCKSWEGFSINVTGASPSEVMECVVTEAPSDTQVVAVCRERANDHDLPKKIKKYMEAEHRPVHLPLPEVRDVVKVRQSRNTLYHRSKMEVSDDEFTQCAASVRCLIKQALCPYFPKGCSDGYLAELDRAASMEAFRRRLADDSAMLKLFQKALIDLEHVMEELRGVGELHQKMGEQREELLRKMKVLKTELAGVVKRLSCLEGKVHDLRGVQDSQNAAIESLQNGQDSQNAANRDLQSGQDSQTTVIQNLQIEQHSQNTAIQDLQHEQDLENTATEGLQNGQDSQSVSTRDLQSGWDLQRAAIQDLQSDHGSHKVSIEDLQHRQDVQIAVIESLQSGQDSQNTAIQYLDCGEDSQNAAIEGLRSGKNLQNTAIQDLQHGQDSQSAAVEGFQSGQDLQSAAIEGLQHGQDPQSTAIQDIQYGQGSQNTASEGFQPGQDSQSAAVEGLQSENNFHKVSIENRQYGQNILSQRTQGVETWPRDPPPGLPPVIIAENTFTEGSSINVSVVVAAGQDNGGDPRLSQPCVPGNELHPQAALKEQAYDEYRRFKLGEGPKGNTEYVDLAVLERPLLSKPEDIKDKMKAMKRFRDCEVRVVNGNTARITPVDLLKKGSPSERIRVVYGQAGCGKTTLLKQACRALSHNGVKSDFDLVLYFPLRYKSVSSASDLQSLLKYYGSENSHLDHAALVHSMVESKGRGLLLVFDGADEMKDLLQPSSGSIVQSILEGRILNEAHVIISSRPDACPSLQDHSACFYEVQGFSHTAITSYVKGFFEATPTAADKMLSQLENRPDLLGGAYIPMNCFILCSIFDQKLATLPATMTACYQAFAAHTTTRECMKEGREVYIDPTLKNLPEDVDDLIMSLGKLAFNGLCHNPPHFVFDESSIRAAFPKLPPGAPIDDSLFKGLLHVHASRQGYQPSVSCSFPHTTQQEFFAALHVSHLPAKKQARFWQDNHSKVSSSVVQRFYAGLTGLGIPKVAKHLCRAVESRGLVESVLGLVKGGNRLVDNCSNANPQLLFLFHTLCESQNIPLTKEVMQHIPTSLMFSLNLSAFDTMAISHCLSQCSHLKQLKLPYPYCTLLSAQCLSHLKAVLQANPQCQLGDCLYLDCDLFSADDAQTLSQVAVSLETFHLMVSHTDCTALSTVCSLPGVTQLGVTVCSEMKDDSGWPLVENSLAKNKRLVWLRLDGCEAFLINMGKALTKSTSIKQLNGAMYGPLPDGVACAFGAGVVAMTQLTHLVMHDLSLSFLKVLLERMEPLENLIVWSYPGVNWDGFSEDEWNEAEEMVATSKVRMVQLVFDRNSIQRPRAIEAISDGLVRNKFIQRIVLSNVPEEMETAVRHKLCNFSVTLHVYS